MSNRTQNGGSTDALLAELASLWGVNLTYRDAKGRMCTSPTDAVFEVLVALMGGNGPSSARDQAWLRSAIERRRAEQGDRLVAPVLVAWDGVFTWADPPGVKVTLLLEDGGRRQIGSGKHKIVHGHHVLRAEGARRVDEAALISAPRRCWEEGGGLGSWGVFAPTYALRSERDWGAGDLTELQGLLDTVSDAGGAVVGVLPVLASFLDRPLEYSPYSPVSRIFWNELYLGVEQLPDWSGCRSARTIWESPDVRERVAILRSRDLVDYAGVMALKRSVLEELCSHFFQEGGTHQREDLAAFVLERPKALAYADFRARVEVHGSDWRYWPSGERCARRSPQSIEELSDSGRYHLYVQWQMDRQMASVSGCVAINGDPANQDERAGLFLDLPVGVHPGGFDVWSRPEMFVRTMSMGAPPDAFFSRGQCWDSPPLHPEMARNSGHDYWCQVLQHHMRFASRLRLDHVMSLHRLFWIPEGREPYEGVYVDYPAAELYAILCLESHRNRTAVTGEDLGTVPAGVRPYMRRHGMSGTWVLQAELHSRSRQVVSDVPRDAVATLGTHDMFPLAGFLRGDDITEHLQIGLLDEAQARRGLAARRRLVARMAAFLTEGGDGEDSNTILAAALSYLGASGAVLKLVDLNDLLLRTDPHNVPGTGQNKANWCRKIKADEGQVRRAVYEAAQSLRPGRL